MQIEFVKLARYLGVYMDNTLSWDDLFDFISKKIIEKLIVLRRVSYFVPLNYRFLIALYFQISLIVVLTVLCNVNNQLYLDKLWKLRKWAAKILLNGRDI